MRYTINPYRRDGVWQFDDAERDLLHEPLVCDLMLMAVLRDSGVFAGAHAGFILDFTDEFPTPNEKGWYYIERAEPESGGVWYTYRGIRGWLCPMLFRYFVDAPPIIRLRPRRPAYVPPPELAHLSHPESHAGH